MPTENTPDSGASARKPLSKRIRFEVFKRDSFKCQYCGAVAPDVVLEVDHIVAVSNGGTNDITNLVTACSACNGGKSNVPLTDAAAVSRSRRQLEELQARREQIEMIADWQRGLLDLEESEFNEAYKFWKELSHYGLNAPGEQQIRNHLKRFGLRAVLSAMQTSTQYFQFAPHGKHPDMGSVEKAFAKIAGICVVAERALEKPYLKDLYYIRGILRKRLEGKYYDHTHALEFMEAAISWGVTVADIRASVSSARNWSHFSEEIDFLIKQAKKEGR